MALYTSAAFVATVSSSDKHFCMQVSMKQQVTHLQTTVVTVP